MPIYNNLCTDSFILRNTPQLAVGMKAKEKPLNDFVNVKNSFDACIFLFGS